MLNTLKYIARLPARTWRRIGIDRRWPALPGGRSWRSSIPLAMHVSFYRGLIQYQHRDIPMQKHPIEVALYPRLVWAVKPRTIIEVGSFAGGSAAWLADMLTSYGIDGRVVSVDIKPPSPSYQPANVTFLKGDTKNLGATLDADFLATLPRPWLVIEDAGHDYAGTIAVMRFFDPLLQSGEYIVVEDANVAEMGEDVRLDGGPGRAIAEFLNARGSSYVIDARYCDLYGSNVTGNPNGYLLKK